MEEKDSVDLMLEENLQDDAALAPETTSLEDAVKDTGEKSEPGWIKKRVETAVEKRLAEVESRLRDEYETRMAPMRDAMYEREADKLVDDGEFKSRERALEYIRLKNGAPQAQSQAPSQAPRNDKGQFAKQDDGVEARANMLYAQAEALQAATGVDVMEIYNSDAEVKRKVATGEWTFLDVYKALPKQQKIPSPTRSANNGSLSDLNIKNMSAAQLAKLDAVLDGGGVINFN